jgi:adenylate kinase
MLNIILFGPPGAGKGTQAKKLAREFHLKHISTGDLLREEIRKDSQCGKKARLFMEEGNLVPDEILIEMLRVVIHENRYIQGFIFDGFPRTLVQAEELDNMFIDENLKVDLVLSLEVSGEALIQRMTKRSLDEGRTDDKPEVFKQRLVNYHDLTEPLLEFYSRQGKLVRVDGMGSIEDITHVLGEEIEKHLHPK